MKHLTISFLCLCFAISSCSQDNLDLDVSSNKSNSQTTVTNSEKQNLMQNFAKTLSKAVSQSKNLRHLIKEEALQKFDNDNDVFIPFVMDKKVQGQSFQDILEKYTTKENLTNLLIKIPYLNIHIPELGMMNVQNMDIENSDLPVIYQNRIYVNGEEVDTLGENDLPAVHSLVLCENNKIVKKHSQRSAHSSNIDDEYYFVSNEFNPQYKVAPRNTRFLEYDEYNEKYDPSAGIIPSNEIDPELIKAYNNSKGNNKAIRYMMYYGLHNVDEKPTHFRGDVRDCIYRVKIADNSFTTVKNTAEGKSLKKSTGDIFKEKVSVKKHRLTREKVLKSIITGIPFVINFKIFSKEMKVDTSRKNNPDDEITIYAMPQELFNIKLNEHRRHRTGLRHSRYTYTIEEGEIKSKWFYPLDHGQDTRLNKWDISKEPINKHFVAYLINPRNGVSEDVTETYTTTFIKEGNITSELSSKSSKTSSSLNTKNTISKTITVHYIMKFTNLRLSDFELNFFEDFPIAEKYPDNSILPISIGKSNVETSIIPISSYFYTTKMRK